MSVYENVLKQLENAKQFLDYDDSYFLQVASPQKIINVSFPVKMDDGSVRIFEGYRVQHNDARGAFKGGIRFHPNTDLDEVKSLAFWMSIKCAVAGIPLGGGKGGITVDPKELSKSELERMTRAFVRKIYEDIGSRRDVPAPDVYTNSEIMGWIVDEYTTLVGKQDLGVVTGKPVEIGGSLGRDTATAQGGFYIMEEILAQMNKDSRMMKFAIQGFGNAGAVMADLISKKGWQVVAVSDSKGGIYNENGVLDLEKIALAKQNSGSVQDIAEQLGYKKITNEELLELDVDVLVPAALENQITINNASNIKAKIIIELANGPTTPEADKILYEKGVLLVPDVLANAGGVVVSYFELVQNLQNFYWSKEKVFRDLEKIMKNAMVEVKEIADKNKINWRTASFVVALGRIFEAMKAKGF